MIMPPAPDGLCFLEPHEVDPLQWEACLAQSPEAILYAHAWYLDAVCVRWAAVVECQAERYVSLFPLPEKSVAGLRQVYQPFFTQQLGLFTTGESRFTQPQDYLACLPSAYLRVRLQFNVNNSWQGSAGPGAFQLKERITYHLPLDQPYETLCQGYSKNQKRNLRKGGASCQVGPGDITQLIALFQENKGLQVAALKEQDYERLARLYQALHRQQAAQVLALREAGQVLAAGLFLFDTRHVIYLFGASTVAGRQQAAMARLLDWLIRQQAGTSRVLDFEGSDRPSLAKFYASFGALPVPYLSLSRTNIPFLPTWLNQKFLS